MQIARPFVDYERDTLGVPTPSRLARQSALEDDGGAASADTTRDAVRNRVNQGPLLRLASIVFIAVATVAFTGATIGGMEILSRMMQGHQIDISDPPFRQ